MAGGRGFGTGVERVRDYALSLPRAYEALVRDSIKFRIGSIVFVAFSPDETIMGFGFPKEERDALVESEPDKFHRPSRPSDLRYNWVEATIDLVDDVELRELVHGAWTMCVPKSVAATRPRP